MAVEDCLKKNDPDPGWVSCYREPWCNDQDLTGLYPVQLPYHRGGYSLLHLKEQLRINYFLSCFSLFLLHKNKIYHRVPAGKGKGGAVAGIAVAAGQNLISARRNIEDFI